MKVERQLSHWQQAGLLDAETVARIVAFERLQPQRPYLLYAVGGLGSLSVAVGLVSIVAANWGDISPQLKLGLDLLLLLLLAVGVFATDLQAKAAAQRANSDGEFEGAAAWGREALIFIYYGATLASIALVAQIYQLGGALYQALLLWSLATAPMLAFGRTRLLMGSWLIALQVTAMMTVQGRFDAAHLSGHRYDLLLATSVALMILITCGVSLIPGLQRRRPELTSAARRLAGTEWLWLMSVFQWGFYTKGELDDVPDRWLMLAAVVVFSAMLASALPKGATEDGAAEDGGESLEPVGRRLLQLLLVVGPLLSFVPWIVPHGKLGVLGALSFLGLWGLVGWTSLRLHKFELFNLATAVLAGRILVIYFEVFGSLLNTGLGLLFGGGLALLLAWGWSRLRRAKKRPAAASAGGPS